MRKCYIFNLISVRLLSSLLFLQINLFSLVYGMQKCHVGGNKHLHEPNFTHASGLSGFISSLTSITHAAAPTPATLKKSGSWTQK